MAASDPSAAPFFRGRPRLPVRGGLGAHKAALRGRRVVNARGSGQVGDLVRVVGGVPDHVQQAVGEDPGQVVDHVQREIGARGGGLAAPQPGGDRQPDRLGQERQADHDRADDPGVAETDLVLASSGPVMRPQRPEDLLSHPVDQGVVDDQQNRGVLGKQALDDRAGQPQTQLVGIPRGFGEERVRPAVRPYPCQPRCGEHAGDRAPPGLRDHPGRQVAEGLERVLREARTSDLKDKQQRRR
jgi:hypothetical protein